MSGNGKEKLTREEVAKLEIGRTDITPQSAGLMTAAFLLIVFSLPVAQLVYEIRQNPGALPQGFHIVRHLPAVAKAFAQEKGGLLDGVFSANAQMLAHINQYEDELAASSLLTKTLVGPTQELMARYLGQGNETGYVGLRNWLFYRPGVDYVTGPGFLDPDQLEKRGKSGNEYTAAPQPDPSKAILEFGQQLGARGIQLIVVPAPSKAMIHPEHFSGRYHSNQGVIQNPSYQAFISKLIQAGVMVFDPAPVLAEARVNADKPQYLETDTHWTPQAVALVAKALADFIAQHARLSGSTVLCKREPVKVSNLGDIAVMLNLPKSQTVFRRQVVEIEQVMSMNNEFWRPRKSSEILLLGDSFTNVYSVADMGWGEAAGLAEQLSYFLKRPLDRIVQNANGAYATRQVLSRELAKGRDRLAGKKLVVWEFAVRELAVGDWRQLDMTVGEPIPSTFIVPQTGQQMVVTGVIDAVSPVPKPRSVPYKDHILTVHLKDVEDVSEAGEKGEAIVYIWSMRDNVWTPAARYRMGQEIRVRLRAWSDVSDKYESINRSELDDEELHLEDPCWGEEVLPR